LEAINVGLCGSLDHLKGSLVDPDAVTFGLDSSRDDGNATKDASFTINL
jgi:hypothetical protein